MTKISDLSALTGATVVPADDLVPVVDMSETGIARNKKMTFAEFILALGEGIDDRVAGLLTEGSNITLTYDDGAGTLTIEAAAVGTGDIADFNEAVDDRIAALLTEGSNITLTYNDGAGTLTIDAAGGGGGSGGVQSTPILAVAMTSRTTNGAATGTTETTTNKVMLSTLDFDASTDEFAQFMFPMPKSWNEGTVTAQFIWTAASGSGDVIWGIQAVAISEADALDAAFGTAQTVTDTLTTASDNHTTSFTSAVTIGGTPAEGDLVCFQVYRDANAGGDTLAVDAKLIGIRLNFTTNAADDS